MGLLNKGTDLITPEMLLSYGFEESVWGAPSGSDWSQVDGTEDFSPTWQPMQRIQRHRWGPEKTIYEKLSEEGKGYYQDWSEGTLINMWYFPETYDGGFYCSPDRRRGALVNPKQVMILDIPVFIRSTVDVYMNCIKIHKNPRHELMKNEVEFAKAYCNCFMEQSVMHDVVLPCVTAKDLRRIIMLVETVNEAVKTYHIL